MFPIILRITLIALVVGIFWIKPTSAAYESTTEMEIRLKYMILDVDAFRSRLKCPTVLDTRIKRDERIECDEGLKSLKYYDKKIKNLKEEISRRKEPADEGGDGGETTTTTTTTPKPDCDPTKIDLNQITYQDC